MEFLDYPVKGHVWHDASRCIVHYGVFDNATGNNATTVSREAIAKHGRPASILTDHGSQFYANQSEYKKGEHQSLKRSWSSWR